MITITSSLSQGKDLIALGNYSHAEGYSTEAQGDHSHSEGELTIAVGKGSHAGGYGTIATLDYQTALGQYNKDLNTEDYFVIGIGEYGSRKDGFGINTARTYISNSLVLPSLTKDSNVGILTYDTSTKKVHYGLLSELSIGNTDYATQALTSSYSELAEEAKHALNASYSDHAQQANTSLTSSYSELAKNATQAENASFAAIAQQAITASYVSWVQNAATASYVSSTQYATTASYIDDSSVVKTYKDVLKLKPVKELPGFMEPGAIALYNNELYFCMGMMGWKKILLSDETITVPVK